MDTPSLEEIERRHKRIEQKEEHREQRLRELGIAKKEPRPLSPQNGFPLLWEMKTFREGQDYFRAQKVLRKNESLLSWIAKEDQENIKRILINDIRRRTEPEYEKAVLHEASNSHIDTLDSLEYGEAYLLLRKNHKLAQFVSENGVDPRLFIPEPDMSFIYEMGVPYKPERYLGPNPTNSHRSSLSRDMRKLQREGLIFLVIGKKRISRFGISAFFYLNLSSELFSRQGRNCGTLGIQEPAERHWFTIY